MPHRRTLFIVALALPALVLLAGLPATGRAGRAALPSATIEARQRFFGAENVDPETGAVDRGEVHLSWVSVATFAAAMDGRVVLFDTYIHKEEDEPHYVPATTQDLVDLRPEAILLGHGHFDHADRSGDIAAATGATIYGTQQHCAQARAEAGAAIPCVAIFDGGATPGGVATFTLLDDICTTAVLHVHSAAEPPDTEHPPAVFVPVPDAGSVLLHPPGKLFDPAGDEGGAVLYQFRMGDFSLVWHDSSGPLKERAPQVFDVLRDLPRTDVQVGAVLGFNQPTNGLRDPAMYVDAIDPAVFIPNHHDFVTEYGSADEYEPAMRAELARFGADPELRWLFDPYDYVRPNLLSFRIDDRRWAGPAGERCPAA